MKYVRKWTPQGISRKIRGGDANQKTQNRKGRQGRKEEERETHLDNAMQKPGKGNVGRREGIAGMGSENNWWGKETSFSRPVKTAENVVVARRWRCVSASSSLPY